MSAVSVVTRLVALCVSLVWAGAGFAADTYPSHPVKIIAPFAAGGPSDFVARLLADKLSQSLGQQFYVEDHAGAGGNIGMTQVARSAPDGYTILVASSSFVVNPSLYAHNPYDPYKDFAPITLAGASANILLAHPSVPAKTVKDLIALMQANPGKYAIANAGLGTTPELAAELFKLDFKLDQPSVPYNGGAPAVQAVIANQTPIGFANLHAGRAAHPRRNVARHRGDFAQAIRGAARRADDDRRRRPGPGIRNHARRLRARRHAAAIIDLLNREIVKALHQPDVQEKCKQVGLDIVADTPAEFAVYIKKEVDRWHKVIVDAKIPQI